MSLSLEEPRARVMQSGKQRDLIVTLRLNAGDHPYRIAADLGVSVSTIRRDMSRMGLKVRGWWVDGLRRRVLKSADPYRLRKWWESGMLEVVSFAGRADAPMKWVTRDALDKFLSNEFTWMFWQPDDLLDSELRARYTRIRARVDWEWLSTREVAERIAYEPDTVSDLCLDGNLPGHKVLNRWYVRSDVLDKWIVECLPHRLPGTKAKPKTDVIPDSRLRDVRVRLTACELEQVKRMTPDERRRKLLA